MIVVNLEENCTVIVLFIPYSCKCSFNNLEREEQERRQREEREKEEREYAEKIAKLDQQAERQRQREKEIEERQRQREIENRRPDEEKVEEPEKPR